MTRVPSDLTTILLALQNKLITDGIFRDTACWLSLTPELGQDQLGKMPAESVALIYPMAMPIEQPVVTGGGNETMLVDEGAVQLILYSRIVLDQTLRSTDLLTKPTIGLLSLLKCCIASWSMFDPTREDGNLILSEPLRPRQIDAPSLTPAGWGRLSSTWRLSFTQEISCP